MNARTDGDDAAMDPRADERDPPGGRAGHPMLASVVLVTAVVLLIVALSVAGTGR